ncbi:MAG TPA: hypothetical protein VHG51_05740 [Longimicrobiaceae bacterium]|nr:hypothetical protein [Longimicrobiaceae bacterium]
MGPPLHLLADATPECGAGHAMRLASLAEEWAAGAGGVVRLAGEVSIPFVRERLAAAGVRVEASGAGPLPGAVLVADSYDAGRRRQGAGAPGAALRVLVDDLGGEVPAGYDAVWNPSACATPALYPGFAGEVLAGAAFVPVRTGLPPWRPCGPGTTAVMLGGGDVPPHLRDALGRLAAELGEARFRGVGGWTPPGWGGIPASDPWREVSGCGVLVTASGSSVWEAAAVGIPMVVVKTAANQERVFRWAVESGAPGVDATSLRDPAALARALGEAHGRAAPLPRIRPGGAHVARTLRALAARRGAGA